MALQPKNRLQSLSFRALRVGVVAGLGIALASCSTQRVVWHAPGEASLLDTASAAVFEGAEVLAARGESDPTEYAWRDPSLSIREVDSQWKDAMWPERPSRRGHYRRFFLPRTADSVIYYQQDSWSSSTQYRSFPSGNSWYRGW